MISNIEFKFSFEILFAKLTDAKFAESNCFPLEGQNPEYRQEVSSSMANYYICNIVLL